MFNAEPNSTVVTRTAARLTTVSATPCPSTLMAAIACVVAAIVFCSSPAAAQETREGQLAGRQADKAERLAPPTLDGLERRLDMLDGIFVARDRRAYPFIGSVIDGGGLAVGPGYRMPFAGTGSIDAHAAWSIRSAREAGVVVTLPAIAGPRVGFTVGANWLNAPDVAYYGIGNDAGGERTGLRYRKTTVGVGARVQASRLFAVGGGFESLSLSTGVTEVASGRTIDPSYARSSLFAEIDSREAARYTRRGGLYRVSYSDYRQVDGSGFSFGRADAEVQRFVPILRENWVIALRGLASTTTVSGGNDVPAVLLPNLGGSHTLRGYPAWRFRDRNRLLLTGEYRWTAGSFVDMALFMDAGKVASRLGDLDLGHLTKSYGIGMSIHTATTTVMRVELARTREGHSVLLSFGPSF